MDDKDEIIDRLSYILKTANRRIDVLESENCILRNKLHNAEYKISKELEPRIQKEKQQYDTWIKNQGVI